MDTAFFRSQVILGGAVPTLMLLWDAQRGQLGANAVNNALHITGILSLVFLFLSLAVTPLRVLTGWNWLIASRRSLGLYGFFYAVLHVIIYVAWDRMGSVVSTFEEIVSRRFLTVGFLAVLLMIPLAVTSTNAMIRRLGAARWKLLHRLAYVVVILGVVHYYMLVKSDVRQPLAFALVLTPLLGFRAVKHYTDLRSDARRAVATPPSTEARNKPKANQFFRGELIVASIFQETPDVKTFRFVNADGGEIPFRHQPGQYMTLNLEIDGAAVRRSYTIASAPSQRSYVELTIKRHQQGVVSRYMHDQVKVGQRIRVAAPGGKFWFDGASNKQVLLIAGGVGITPTMSMLRYLTDTGWMGQIYFLNAVRTTRDLIFAAELTALVSRHANLTLVNFVSQAKSDELSESPISNETSQRSLVHRRGYISSEAIGELVPNVITTPVYLCGPEPMMAAMRNTLEQLGVTPSQIFTEEFVSIKSPSADRETATPDVSDPETTESITSQVKFAKSKSMAEWLPEQSLLEVAEAHGVHVDFECRSGICGQCKVRCLSGRVRMDVTDALSQAERKSGWVLACQARAASEAIEIEA